MSTPNLAMYGAMAMRSGDSQRLAHHVVEVLRASHSATRARHLSADEANALFKAAVGIVMVLAEAHDRPADNIIDLDAERRRRR